MRNVSPEKPRNRAGSLRVAHPSMLDASFRRAVLFISAHDPDDGAIGVIINRPLDKIVADLVSETPPQHLADVPVFFGGPVGNNQLMLAAFEWQKGEGLKLNQHSLNADEAAADESGGAPSVRAFLGYAGWSAGQLEAEMKQKAGIVQKPSRSALKFERLSRRWFDIMNRLGPWYRMLAAAKIVDLVKDVLGGADMIVKVKGPLPAEFPLLRKGQILFTYLHLAASKPLTEALLKSGVTGIAYETIQIGNRLPLLEPMSEIAGRMSVVMGADFLAKYNAGSKPLLGLRP